MPVLSLTNERFSEEVLTEKGPVLVDFYADWCGPCKMMAPLVEAIAQEHPQIKVAKVNIDQQPQLAQQYGVMSIPTLIVFREGKPAVVSTGARPKAQIEALLK